MEMKRSREVGIRPTWGVQEEECWRQDKGSSYGDCGLIASEIGLEMAEQEINIMAVWNWLRFGIRGRKLRSLLKLLWQS